MIEDISDVQALMSMRKFYTDDAGYALAKRVDRELHLRGIGLQGGAAGGTAATNYNAAVIGGDGITAFGTANGSTLTDAGIRRMIRTLDDADIPVMDRFIVIPPIEKQNLLGLSRFTEQAFVGEAGSANSIRNGRIANIYGHEVYVSSQCPWLHTESGADEAYVTFTSTNPSGTDEVGTTIAIASPGATQRVGLIAHRSAIGLVEQLGVRVQSQYTLDFLGTQLVADTIFGTGELRNDGGVAFVVPAT